MIEQLTADLPEVYQPIYGHPALSTHVSRTCSDRLEHIVRVHDNLRSLLGRPLNVLDLGCAQGFFCFNLAERGANVHGVDYLDKNIALCNAIAHSHPQLSVSFEVGRVEDAIERLEPGRYDLVLGLSIFHHIIHEKGVEAVKRLLERAATLSGALVVELALREEPLYWGPSQPEDPRTLLNTIAFFHEFARHATHLAPISRPLFVASNRYWILGDEVCSFESWSTEPHALADDVHQGGRRYFFSTDRVLKMYRLDHPRWAYNEPGFSQEIQFLQSPPTKFPAPALIAYNKDEASAWLVEQRIPGRLLLDLLREGVTLNHRAVVLGVLAQLVVLEKAGLYHNDVRTWNVLVALDGTTHLIDYGSISTNELDCVWPSNRFLSFFIFVREVASGVVESPEPLRSISISPYGLPQPYRSWAASLWRRPLAEWSFGLLHQALLEVSADELDESTWFPSEAWMKATEDAIQTLKLFANQLRHRAHAQVAQVGERVGQAETQAVLAGEHAGHAGAQAAQASEHAARAEALATQASERAGQAETRATLTGECAVRAEAQATQASEHAGHAEAQAKQASEHAGHAEAQAKQASEHAGHAEAQAALVGERAALVGERAALVGERAALAGECAIRAEAQATQANERASRAEAQAAYANEHAAQAEAQATQASECASHAEAQAAYANEHAAQAEAQAAQASERAGHAEARAAQASERAGHAEARAAQASERAGHAEAQAAQASERAGHAEAQAAQASERASQAEAAAYNAWLEYQLVINSRSWRATAPLRWVVGRAKWFVRGSVAWLTLKPGSRPRRTVRQTVLHMRNWVLLRPRIKSKVLSLLRRFPRIESWLRRLHRANPTPLALPLIPQSSNEMLTTLEEDRSSDSVENLSPRARKIYADLKSVMVRRRQGED